MSQYTDPTAITQPRRGGQTPPRGCGAFLLDIYHGAVLGDFAPELGLAGALTQILFGYLPGIGTLCALRDALADWHLRDYLDLLLNLLAVIPLFGGLAKTIEVLHHMRRIGRALHVTHRQRHLPAAKR
jgi:hypothetical protein